MTEDDMNIDVNPKGGKKTSTKPKKKKKTATIKAISSKKKSKTVDTLDQLSSQKKKKIKKTYTPKAAQVAATSCTKKPKKANKDLDDPSPVSEGFRKTTSVDPIVRHSLQVKSESIDNLEIDPILESSEIEEKAGIAIADDQPKATKATGPPVCTRAGYVVIDSRKPVTLTICPKCRQHNVRTKTHTKPVGDTVLWCCVLSCLFWPLCWLPFCLDSAQQTNHYVKP